MQQLKPNDVVVYTDGSGLDGKIGYGYRISTNMNQTKIANNFGSLPNFCTVFQAEVVAITQACIKMTELNVTDKNIYIFSDSLSAIKALNQLRISSFTILNCLSRINEVAANNSVSLNWVPGHINIPGNEEADGLSREGITTNTNVVGYMPYSYIKKTINNKVHTDSSETWTLKQSNHMKKTVNMNNKLSRDLQKLMNIHKKYRLAIHLLTGHIALNHHLNKIKVENSPLCPYCHLERETTEHFLGKCPVFYYHRQNHFDTHFATLAELIKSTNLNKIIKYTIDTKRFIEDVS